MIAEDATLLEGAKKFRVTGSKHKKVISVDKEEHWPLKKAKGKYCKNNVVKIGGANPCERCVYAE